MNDFIENEVNGEEFPPLDFTFKLGDNYPELAVEDLSLYTADSCDQIFIDPLDMWNPQDLSMDNSDLNLSGSISLKEEEESTVMVKFDQDMEVVNLKKNARGTNKRVHEATPKTVKKAKGSVKKEKVEESKKDQEERNEKRLEANKKSAQLSRERKKAMRNVLENEAAELTLENKQLSNTISVLKTENEMLKGELLSLQEMLLNTPIAKFVEQQKNQLEQNGTPIPVQPNAAASSWYTLIVLHIFSQYFQTLPGNNPSTSGVAPQPNWVM